MTHVTIIVMGVSGSGKTTIGQRLSRRLGIPFLDADDFHPESNVRKMAAGTPLDDEDRKPWLERLSQILAEHANTGGIVLACSALKEDYRKILARQTGKPTWVFLQGEYALIMERMQNRSDHYMPPALLRSQFEDLEKPQYDIKVDITSAPAVITENILAKLHPDRAAEFGVIGLGVMGANISWNIAEKRIALSVYNRPDNGEVSLLDDFVSGLQPEMDVIGYTDLIPFVESIARPRKILLMVKAGKATDDIIRRLTPLLEKGDVLIDGGNAHYADTERRQAQLTRHGISLVGCGISGGEKGARYGPSLMPGGEREACIPVQRILERIAAPDRNGRPCCSYIGPGGAGHFVKMVHNGIEYGEMQLLAETWHLLSRQWHYPEIADLFDEWNEGDLSGYLLEITTQVLRRKKGEAYLLDQVLDEAGSKGTGGWSVTAALELGSVNTIMSAAVFARYQSSDKPSRVALARKVNERVSRDAPIDPAVLKSAYMFARILNHHQGFSLLRDASSAYQWDLDLPEIARTWTNGCILRSAFMEECVSILSDADQLVDHPRLRGRFIASEGELVSVLRTGLELRLPLPAYSAAREGWVAMTTGQLPANLIQAQRDFFGAHTYRLKHDPGGPPVHTNWESDD